MLIPQADEVGARAFTMTSQSYGDLKLDYSFIRPRAPTVDHSVRAMYCKLLNKPVPDRFLQLFNRDENDKDNQSSSPKPNSQINNGTL
jgi:hypothetical protein